MVLEYVPAENLRKVGVYLLSVERVVGLGGAAIGLPEGGMGGYLSHIVAVHFSDDVDCHDHQHNEQYSSQHRQYNKQQIRAGLFRIPERDQHLVVIAVPERHSDIFPLGADFHGILGVGFIDLVLASAQHVVGPPRVLTIVLFELNKINDICAGGAVIQGYFIGRAGNGKSYVVAGIGVLF